MKEDLPIAFQRIESVAIAFLALAMYIKFGFAWYFLPIGFLAIDLSALGYLANARIGALTYNAAHSYLVPVVILLVVVAMQNFPEALLCVSLIWIFHIAVDRSMGYGLKYPDSFAHTHLGQIIRDRG
jgi:hypothetical protein